MCIRDRAEGEPNEATSGTKRIRSCCRGCGKMECGVWVTVQDGRAIRIEGDESAFQSMGHCCSKSQSSMQAAYHPDRLYYPMKRTAARGEDDPGWVRIKMCIRDRFNTVTNSLILRRREFAVMKSVGLSNRQFRAMVAEECVAWCIRGLVPVSYTHLAAAQVLIAATRAWKGASCGFCWLRMTMPSCGR